MLQLTERLVGCQVLDNQSQEVAGRDTCLRAVMARLGGWIANYLYDILILCVCMVASSIDCSPSTTVIQTVSPPSPRALLC
jgi:hypothetical protein